jgi:hypothetical protein
MTEHIVLIFAYHFPPENAIGGARPFRFSKYLARLGYTCRVFTAAKQTGGDASHIEYVPDPFIAYPRRGIGWQVERAIRKTVLPAELGTRWSSLAFHAAQAYIRAHCGARVTSFSTFPPIGPHLAAYQLARAEGVPWIADFRDPLPEQKTKGISFQTHVYRWLGRFIAQRADAVIANTDAAMIGWQEKFPKFNDKFHLIWNGFDPEERIQALPVLSQDCKTLSHVGELYDGRNAVSILESLARLITSGRLSAGSVMVRLIGETVTRALPDQEFVDRARAEGWLDLVTERIPQRQARRIAQSSDSLLLLQPQSATQVPGKLFEYLQIGRPILAFVQPDSPSERLLARSGVPYRCVYPGCAPELVDDTVAEFFSLPSEPVAASPWYEEQFNAENQMRQLDAIIRSLHNKPAREAAKLPRSLAADLSISSNQNTRISEETEKSSANFVHRA